jgi:hypothetical protein
MSTESSCRTVVGKNPAAGQRWNNKKGEQRIYQTNILGEWNSQRRSMVSFINKQHSFHVNGSYLRMHELYICASGPFDSNVPNEKSFSASLLHCYQNNIATMQMLINTNKTTDDNFLIKNVSLEIYPTLHVYNSTCKRFTTKLFSVR